jgi:hypothetical protein
MRRAALYLLFLVPLAGEPKVKLTAIQVAPGDFSLSGKWAAQRIVVTGRLADGALRDVTGQAQFKSSNRKVAAVGKTGIVSPVADGEANIEVAAGGKKQKLHVTVKGSREAAAAFLTEVRPLLSKFRCNATECHGAARGQGGLRLSLFGGEPQADFDALTRAHGGRRFNRVDPEQSLLHTVHGGTGDIILAWLTAGAPWTNAAKAQIASLQVYPEERVLPKGQGQRLLVTATFTDGEVRDVTGDAAYHSSAPKIASVSGEGVVRTEATGDAAIVVTYQRQSAVFRVAVRPKPFPALTANNRIDELVWAKLRKMGVPPSALASDEVFVRRVYLDTIGLLPTAEEARAFLAHPDRARLVDALLARDEFNDFWSLKWGDILRIKSEYPVRVWPKAVAVYYQWVHDSLQSNKPYDEFARELLTATGSNFRVAPANFVRAVSNHDARTVEETAALVFMGARIGCARCHAHPLESWGLEDDYALGAFFARVNYKSTQEWKEEIVYPDFRLNLRYPDTRAVVEPHAPGGATVKVGAEEDPRAQFAAWLTAPDNPWFAKNMVNRIWFWLMGRGIIHEPDDIAREPAE